MRLLLTAIGLFTLVLFLTTVTMGIIGYDPLLGLVALFIYLLGFGLLVGGKPYKTPRK